MSRGGQDYRMMAAVERDLAQLRKRADAEWSDFLKRARAYEPTPLSQIGQRP